MGQYGSGDRSSTHHSMLRSSTSWRSERPKAAAVSAMEATFLLVTYGTRASSRCSRVVLARADARLPAAAPACRDTADPGGPAAPGPAAPGPDAGGPAAPGPASPGPAASGSAVPALSAPPSP